MAAADAISFYRDGREGITAETRRTGRPWKKLAAETGEHVYYRPAVSGHGRSGTRAKRYVGRHVGHHARTGSILVMTEKGVVKAACFRRMPPGDRWSLDGWSNLRGLPWDVAEVPAGAASETAEQLRPRAIMSVARLGLTNGT